jgi:ubiquinone/menaquinone biosynthesis C-methylase UbiE
MKDYKEVNAELTKNLLKKLKDQHYVNLKMKNKLNSFKFLSKHIKNNKLKLLDIGCRDGMWFDVLKKNGWSNFFGVELSETALEVCKGKGYSAVQGDAHSLPVESNSYDIVSIIHTLEHCPDIPKVVSEIKRVLKPNGFVFVVVPMQKKEKVPTVWGHYFCFSKPDEVINFFKKDFTKVVIDKKHKQHNRFIFRLKENKNE